MLGKGEPVSVLVETFGTAKVAEDKIGKAVRAGHPMFGGPQKGEGNALGRGCTG